jgi:hypothetical protein
LSGFLPAPVAVIKRDRLFDSDDCGFGDDIAIAESRQKYIYFYNPRCNLWSMILVAKSVK